MQKITRPIVIGMQTLAMSDHAALVIGIVERVRWEVRVDLNEWSRFSVAKKKFVQSFHILRRNRDTAVNLKRKSLFPLGHMVIRVLARDLSQEDKVVLMIGILSAKSV